MGKANTVIKQYMQDNTKFADVCNYYLYDGKEVIKAEDLEEKDVTELALPKGLKGVAAVEKIRDILKSCCIKTAKGVTYLLIGIENQSDAHYAMVVRNMLYDALNYASQVDAHAKEHRKNKDVTGSEFLSGFAKEDRLTPVITLTIYWKLGRWDGARSLHEMLQVKDRRLLRFVSDYKLNLIVPEENMSFEAIQLLNECFDAKIDNEKGAGNVCKGIDELVARGEARGKAEGEARLSKLVNILCSQKKYEEIQLVTSDVEKRQQMYKEYGIL